ncbi:hypothetical protein FRC00_003801, partial [Tulasnella sp. 408]
MLDGKLKVAVKQLRIVQASGTRVRVAMRLARELKIWARAKHPNILKLVGYYLSENYSCAQLVSPYMENGNIIQYIHLTQAGIEARLGFANVLISDEPAAILCDFGLATFIQDSGVSSGLTTSRSIKGSTRYMSPELFHDAEAQHTLKSDIWAWACTVFEVITDTVPYAAFPSDGSVMLALVQGTPPGSVELFGSRVPKLDTPLLLTSTALQNLISECWNMAPGERPSVPSLLERLNFVDVENPDPAPTRPLSEEAGTRGVVVDGLKARSPPILSENLDEGGRYSRTALATRTAIFWHSERPPDPEVVLRLDAPNGECLMQAAPNGKWL